MDCHRLLGWFSADVESSMDQVERLRTEATFREAVPLELALA